MKKNAVIIVIVFFLCIAYFLLNKNQKNLNLYQSNEASKELESTIRDNKNVIDNKISSDQKKDENESGQNVTNSLSSKGDEKNLPSLSNTKNSAYIDKGLLLIVKDEKGGFVSQAKITLDNYFEKKTVCTLYTDNNGQALLPAIESLYSFIFTLQISHPDFVIKIIQEFNRKNYRSDTPLTLILSKGIKIKGIALDQNGNLLEGVAINLKKFNQKCNENFLVGSTKSQKDGVFEFSHVDNGDYCFSGLGNGFVLFESKRYVVPFKEDIILTFVKGREHTLKVINIEGKSISKAKVCYFYPINGRLIEISLETNEQGICILTFMESRNIQLIVSHPQYLEFNSKNAFQYGDSEPNQVTLSRNYLVKGKIIDSASRQPIPNAVVLSWNEISGEYIQTKTNMSGEYTLSGFPELNVYLMAYCFGYQESAPNKFLVSSKKENIKNFELTKLKHFTIKCIDQKTNKPIANMSVYNEFDKINYEPIITNDNGEFSYPFKRIDSKFLKVSLSIAGYARVTHFIYPVDETVIVYFTPSALLHVSIIGYSNKSMDELKIECIVTSEIDKKATMHYVVYDSELKIFKILGLPEGVVNLEFTVDDFYFYKTTIEMKSDKDNKIEIPLKLNRHLIIKISTDDNLLPPDLSGRLLELNTYSNKYEEGNCLKYNYEKNYFECFLQDKETNNVKVKFPNYNLSAAYPITLNTEGTAELEIKIVKGLGIEGDIYNSKGQKITNATVSLDLIVNDTPTSLWSESDGCLDAVYYNNKVNYISLQNGHFSSYGYTSAKYHLKVTHSEYLTYHEEIQLISDSIYNKQIILKKGTSISGEITNSEGLLVSNANMILVIKNEVNLQVPIDFSLYQGFRTKTDEKGRYIFKNLPEGNYLLSIVSLSGKLFKHEISIIEGNDLTYLNFKLEDIYEISGVIEDENGKPLPRINMYLEGNDSFSVDRWFASDDKGFFSFSPVEKVEYAITLSEHLKKYKLEAPVKVTGGDKNVKIIAKTSPRKKIFGKVYYPDGKICTQYSLSYLDVENQTQKKIFEFKISPNGFEVEIISEGLQTIQLIVETLDYPICLSDPIILNQYSEQPINLTLKNKKTLDLVVLDINTRKPIAHAYGNIRDKNNISRDYLNNDKESDIDGHLKLFVSMFGENTITINAPNFLETVIEVDIHEDSKPIEVFMGKGGIIKGTITDILNKTIPFTEIVATRCMPIETDENGNVKNTYYPNLICNSDEQGKFEFNLVPPGNYYISTKIPSKIQIKDLFRGIPLNVEESGVYNLQLDTIDKYISFSKLNISLKGKLISNKEIKLSYLTPINFNYPVECITQNSTADGNVLFVDVPKGEYLLTINGFEEQITKQITVKDDEVKIEIEVGK